jgi:hypothetical protein
VPPSLTVPESLHAGARIGVENTTDPIGGRAYPRLMRTVWKTLRLQSRKYPSVRVLLLIGAFGMTLSPVLIAAGMALVGQLVAGLAILPLTFVVYLCTLLAVGRPDDNGGGGSSGDNDEPDAPRPQHPGDGVDWERFERDFRAHVDERVPVA